MLSRTADSLFWLARYMERAEYTARLVDMGRRIGAIPGSGPGCFGGRRSEWPAILAATGCTEGYNARRWAGDYAPLDEAMATCRYLLIEPENPSSVRASFEAARANARSIRAALTRETWESINDAWNQFRRLTDDDVRNGALRTLLESIKTATAQFRGATEGSALRNDGYEFLSLGFAVERLDCTARLLDVKAAQAHEAADGGVIDRYRWVALLRACGQVLAYRAHFRADYDGALINKFLITQAESPRSLMYSALEVETRLTRLSVYYGAPCDCLGEARELIALIRRAPTDHADALQLHSFLSQVIAANSRLSAAIAAAYHFGAPALADREEARAQAEKLDDSGEKRPRKRNGKSRTARQGAAQSQASSDGAQLQM